MKQTIVVLMAAALTVPMFGQGALKERQENQKDRIKAGVKDGSLTRKEAKNLKQDQKEIRQDIKGARADGVVTGKEAAKISREQNKASRDIYKQKNDKQDRK